MAKGFRRLFRKFGGSSSSAPEAATWTSADFVPALSSPSTLVSVSDVQEADPKHSSPRNSARSIAWNGLETSLRVLRDSSDGFPPLKSVVGGLLAVVNVVQAAAANREDYETLSLELRTMAETLTKYTNGLASMGQTGNIARIFHSMELEIAHIAQQQEHSRTRRFLEASQDGGDVIKRYRKIEALFRQLHTDISLRTWDDARKLREDALLQKLSPVHDAQFNSSFSTTIKRRGCTAKTREKVQQDLQEWAVAANGTEVIYWMNGMAGTGKSTIAYSFCKSLESSQQLGGNFFCSRLSASCHSVNSIVPTLAYQLAHYSLAFRAALCDILDEHPDSGKRDIRWQFQKLLQQPMRRAELAIQEDVIVVIDALDECTDMAAVGLFLDAALQLSAGFPIKFFITSRPEPVIQDRMLKHPHATRLHLHDIEETIVAGDIWEYLQDAFAAMTPPPSAVELRQLAERSGNLFIYAATAVRYVLPDVGSVNSINRLKTVLQPHLTRSTSKQYAELNMLYTGVLSAALDQDALEVEEVDDMRRVLWTVLCAKEPIIITMIATLLALSEQQVHYSLEPLQSVLHLEEASGWVSALHASFPDFMFDESRSKESRCDSVLHSEVLANACFDVMARELCFNICNLESSSMFDDEVPNLKGRIERAISPALSYACRFWATHLQEGSNTIPAHSKFVDFLTQRLLFWMEVVNFLKVMFLGSEVLQRAATWLTDSQSDTRKLLEDAMSFVSRYASGACNRSTPHIYISRLPFCLKSSLIYKTYWERTRGLIDLKGAAIIERALDAPSVWFAGSAVYSMALSPDGTRVVSGSSDTTIRVWDARTGETVVGPIVGHSGSVHSVVFSPDGTRIASGSADKTVQVCDAHNGESVAGPFVGHQGRVMSVAFSPEGDRIVSGSHDKTIRIWDARTGMPIAGPFTEHRNSVIAVAFSRDGSRVVSSSDNINIQVWDSRNGETLGEPFAGHTDQVRSIAFSRDGGLIVSGSMDETIRVWDVRTGECVAGALSGHSGWINSVAFSSDGNRIVSGSSDEKLRVWDAQTGECVAGPFIGHQDDVTSVAFFPDGDRIASSSRDKTIRVWDVRNGESITRPGQFSGHELEVYSVAFTPGGDKIASGLRDNTIRIWDAQTGESIGKPFSGHEHGVNSVAFSPDGCSIASGSRDKTIRVWDARTAKCVAGPLIGHEGWVRSVSFSPDGGRIASGSGDKTIRVWDCRTGELVVGPLRGHENGVNCVAFFPDGNRIVSGSRDKSIRVWNAWTGECFSQLFVGHEASVNSVAVSPDGARIVSGSGDKTLRVWNALTGQCVVGPLTGHEGWVRAVAFSPDGAHVASASDDQTIRVWDTLTGQSIAGPLCGHTDEVQSIAFSADGTRIVSGSKDNTIRVWDASTRSASPSTGVFTVTGRDSSSIPAFTFSKDGCTLCNGLPFLWVPPDDLSHFPYPHTVIRLLSVREGLNP